MPPLPLVPNVLKTQLLWSNEAGLDMLTGQFWRYAGSPPSATDCGNFATTIANAYGALDAYWHNSFFLVGAKATDLSSASGGVGSATSSFGGALNGGLLSGGTALVANYQINRRYRGGKPRNYLPWGDGTKLSGLQSWSNTWLAAAEPAIAGANASFIGTVEGATTISSHVNVSYYDGFTVVTSPTTGRSRNVPKLRTVPVVDDIVGTTLLGRPGSQRRRN